MAFDALALHAVRDELATTIVGGRVQQVFLLSSHSLGLEIYARGRRFVFITTDPTEARVHLVSTSLKRGSESVTPLLLLLRKHARDGRVAAAEQPRLERLLTLRITSRQDDGAIHRVALIIEAMGRRSNLVLVDEDGAILDALTRLPPSRNPTRPLLPHLRYAAPPTQDRLDPESESTVACLRDEALERPQAPRLADLLGTRLAGCSPQLARELAWRAAGSVDTPADRSTDWLAVQAALAEMFRPMHDGSWQPTVAWQAGKPVAFAPYRLGHLQGVELRSTETISEAIETYYASGEWQVASGKSAVTGLLGSKLQPLAAKLVKTIQGRREQLRRKAAALERELAEATNVDELRSSGEAVLASASGIALGQQMLAWDGRSIPLDPTLSPVENAQRYFKEYRKARDAVQRLPDILRQTQLDINHLDELAAMLASASDPGHVRALRAELEEALARSDGRGQAGAGGVRTKKQRGKQAPRKPSAAYKRVLTEHGFDILIGSSAHGNESVTFKLAEPRDVWLHARGVPGAHVVVRSRGQAAPREVLVRAAQLAAAHSAATASGKVAVDWTERRYVRKLRGGHPGQVIYSGEHTIMVEPMSERERARG